MAQIYKRGKTWTVRFSKRQHQWDPKQQKTTSVLKQKSKGGFKTKAEARAYGIKMESESLSGVDVTKNPVFAEYFMNWIKTVKLPAVRTSTRNRYLINANFVKQYFGPLHIKDINRQQYQDFINWFAKNHAKVTVRMINTMCRSCVTYAIDDGLINRNFTHQVKLSGNKKRERPVEYLSVAELKKLNGLCQNGLNCRYTSRYMILVAIHTGARLGEISALHWPDIDFKNDMIRINKSWNQDRQEMSDTKNAASHRAIKVDHKIIKLIGQLKENNSDFVFGLPTTKYPPSSNGVNKTLRELLHKAGIVKRNFHFHSLRHTHVGYLIARGVDIYVISKRLGHANITTTLDVYANLLKEYKTKQDNKIISLLNDL